jgi:hypothetical protein
MVEISTEIKEQFLGIHCSAVRVHHSKKKLCGLSPRTNYTDRATAACHRSQCQLLRLEAVSWSARRIPYGRILGFLDRGRIYKENWKGKAILAMGSQGCEMSRLPQLLDNRLTDGGDAVGRTRRPTFNPRRLLVLISVRRWVDPQGHSVAKRIRLIEYSNDLIGNWTNDLPACSTVSQPTILPIGLLQGKHLGNNFIYSNFMFTSNKARVHSK